MTGLWYFILKPKFKTWRVAGVLWRQNTERSDISALTLHSDLEWPQGPEHVGWHVTAHQDRLEVDGPAFLNAAQDDANRCTT